MKIANLTPVSVLVDGKLRSGEVRGHCFKGTDLYDVMLHDTREIVLYVPPERLTQVAIGGEGGR